MNQDSHQTARLKAGRHLSPNSGVCVMELASMLAGEPFTDQPRSACPVIGALLRCYNDGIGDEWRQDLYWCASAVVGTRRWRDRGWRADRAASFFGVRRPLWSKVFSLYGLRLVAEACVDYARNATREQHESFLALIGELTGAGHATAPFSSAAVAGLARTPD
jgi:hypothetical protein